jgi:hypothetical protein
MMIADPTDARPRRRLIVCEAAPLLRGNRRLARRGAVSTSPGLLAALATIAAAILAASAVGGAGFYDSGWSVAKPSTALDDHPANDPATSAAVNHLLAQSQVPLLRTPSPDLATTAEKIHNASQQGNSNGWRPAPIKFAHPTDAASPPIAKLGEPLPVTEEAECGGPEREVETKHNGMELRAPLATFDEEASADAASDSVADENQAVAAPAAETPLVLKKDPATSNSNESASDAMQRALAKLAHAHDEKPSVSTEPAANDSGPQTVTVQRMPLSEDVPVVKKRPEDSPLVEPLKGPLPPMTKSMQNLRNKVRTVLKMYYNKPLNSRDNDTWEMMHGMLAYGLRSQIREGGPKGDLITAVGWLCYNKPCKGLTLMYVTPDGELRAKQGAGLQGHMGQLLAMLAQCRVSPDYPIKVGDHDFTVRDLVEVEKKTCYEKTELTFKLIGLMHYLNSDDKWVNDQGMEWDIPKLISEELAQPIRGAACGGTHRLSGLSLAARTRVRRGEPLDGEFAQASEFVEKYHNYAFQLQNSDGSLSTDWFRGKGDDDDNDRRVKTTGHILEWLCYSLNDDQMKSNRVFSAANYLATLLYSNYDHEWEKGPIGHAIHALRLYDERMLQPYDNAENIASQKPPRTSQAGSKSRSQQR